MKRLKKKFHDFASYVVILLFIFITIYRCTRENTRNSTTLFLLDTSLSMLKDDTHPFQRAKEFIGDKIEACEMEDRIVVITFDEITDQVVNSTISSALHRNDITEQVNRLRIKGQWTWMRKGLERLKQTIHSTESKYSMHKIEVYFITDGKDDPPPNSGEPKTPMASLIHQGFSGYETVDSCIYALYYDSESINVVDIKPIEDKTHLRMKHIAQSRTQPESEPEPPLVRRESESQPPMVKPELSAVKPESDSEPPLVEDESEPKPPMVKSELSAAKPESEPEPPQFKHESESRPSPIQNILAGRIFTRRNVILFFVILTLVVLIVIISKMTTIFKIMTVRAEGEMNGQAASIKVNAWRKSFLEELELPNYYLIMDRFRSIIYLGETISKRIYFLKNGKKISCVLPSGKRRYFIFRY